MFVAATLLSLAAATSSAATIPDQPDCATASASSATPDYMAMMMGESGSRIDTAPKAPVNTGPASQPPKPRKNMVPGKMAGLLSMEHPAIPLMEKPKSDSADRDQQTPEEAAGICNAKNHG